MLSQAVLFTAITIVCFYSEIYCDPAPAQDNFGNILELVNQPNAVHDREVKNVKYESDSTEEDRKHYGSLKSQEIIQLIQKATQDSESQDNRNDDDASVQFEKVTSNKHRNKDDTDTSRYYFKESSENKLNDGLLYNYQLNSKKEEKYRDDDERYDHSRFNEEALEQLLSQNVLNKQSLGKQNYQLVPNPLVGSTGFKNDRTEDRNNLDAYSKVYVILNPKAIAKSGNKDKLNSLLSKILSLTSAPRGLDQEKNTRQNRYKGFPVLQMSRRVRRDSREMFVKDSMEDDFKPKRARNDRGGGGGGGSGGGRTAIPYIRHRGDIYERDD